MRTLFTLKHQIKERQRQRRRPVAPPSPSHRSRSSAQRPPDRPLERRSLRRRCQRNSPVKTSNIVGLEFGWTGHRLGWTGKRLEWTSDNPRRRLFPCGGGGGSSVHAQNDGQQVLRVAPKRFLTEDEARHQQWKMIQVVHPRSTWASQDEERSTQFFRLSYSRRYSCRRRIVGTWTAAICVPAYTRRDRAFAANPRSCRCSHKRYHRRTSQTAEEEHRDGTS